MTLLKRPILKTGLIYFEWIQQRHIMAYGGTRLELTYDMITKKL